MTNGLPVSEVSAARVELLEPERDGGLSLQVNGNGGKLARVAVNERTRVSSAPSPSVSDCASARVRVDCALAKHRHLSSDDRDIRLDVVPVASGDEMFDGGLPPGGVQRSAPRRRSADRLRQLPEATANRAELEFERRDRLAQRRWRGACRRVAVDGTILQCRNDLLHAPRLAFEPGSVKLSGCIQVHRSRIVSDRFTAREPGIHPILAP